MERVVVSHCVDLRKRRNGRAHARVMERLVVTVVLTLLYHNVLSEPADGLPVAGHQVTVDAFREHIYRLRRILLHPREVHDELMRGKNPQGVVITFDDGATGIIEAGKILAEVGTAGVAFICPGAIGGGLWFYRLADALVRASVTRLTWGGTELPLALPGGKQSAYKRLSTELFDLPAVERNDCLTRIVSGCRPKAGDPLPSLSVLDQKGLERAAETGGLIFGNHSWSHPNLVTLSSAELMYEVQAAHHWLESSRLSCLPWFAFPRGSYDARVRKVVSQFCPIAFGAKVREASPDVFPRTSIYHLDANKIRFTIKTAWEGRLRTILPV